MADASLTIDNAAALAALAAGDAAAIAALRQAIERWLLRRQAELARYPSPPPASRYRRTGTLGRAWTSARPDWQASAGSFRARVGNATTYAPYVQGQRQANVHAGRWRTVEAVGRGAQAELDAAIAAAMAAVEAQINGGTA